MLKNLIVIMFTTLIINASFAQSLPATNGKVYDEENKNIMVTSKNATFTITLKSNPTTGYSWFVREYDRDFIKPISHRFDKPDSALIGSAGAETFVFHVEPNTFIVPTQTVLRLTYSRPFQGSDGAKQVLFYISASH